MDQDYGAGVSWAQVHAETVNQHHSQTMEQDMISKHRTEDCSKRKEPLSLIHLNICGLCGKRDALQDLINRRDPDVVGLLKLTLIEESPLQS